MGQTQLGLLLPDFAKQQAPRGLDASHVGIALLFVLFWLALGSMVAEIAKRHDFLNLYVGAKLAGEGRFAELHDPDVQFGLERQLSDAVPELVPFVRPHFYALLLAPLSWLSLDAAFIVWVCIQVAILFAVWHWGVRAFGPDALVLGAMFLPAAMGVAHGQDGAFLMAAVAASWSLASKGKDGIAGAVLALCLAKFHLMLCVPVALMFAHRWIMLRGFASMGAALALISVWLGGWQGAQKYVALLQMKDLNRLSPSPDLMVNVHSIGANLQIDSMWLSGSLVCATLALLAAASWKAPLNQLFPAMLAASLLVPPHVYAYDMTLLLPAILLTSFAAEGRTAKIFSLLLVAPVVYFVALAGMPWSALTSVVLFGFLAAHAAGRFVHSSSSTVTEISSSTPGRLTNRSPVRQ